MAYDLKSESGRIKSESTAGANTAERVGTWMEQASDEISSKASQSDFAQLTDYVNREVGSLKPKVDSNTHDIAEMQHDVGVLTTDLNTLGSDVSDHVENNSVKQHINIISGTDASAKIDSATVPGVYEISETLTGKGFNNKFLVVTTKKPGNSTYLMCNQMLIDLNNKQITTREGQQNGSDPFVWSEWRESAELPSLPGIDYVKNGQNEIVDIVSDEIIGIGSNNLRNILISPVDGNALHKTEIGGASINFNTAGDFKYNGKTIATVDQMPDTSVINTAYGEIIMLPPNGMVMYSNDNASTAISLYNDRITIGDIGGAGSIVNVVTDPYIPGSIFTYNNKEVATVDQIPDTSKFVNNGVNESVNITLSGADEPHFHIKDSQNKKILSISPEFGVELDSTGLDFNAKDSIKLNSKTRDIGLNAYENIEIKANLGDINLNTEDGKLLYNGSEVAIVGQMSDASGLLNKTNDFLPVKSTDKLIDSKIRQKTTSNGYEVVVTKGTNSDTERVLDVEGKMRAKKLHLGSASSDTYVLDVSNITYNTGSGSKTTEGSRFKDNIIIEDTRSNSSKPALQVKNGLIDFADSGQKNVISNLGGNTVIKANDSIELIVATMQGASASKVKIQGGLDNNGQLIVGSGLASGITDTTFTVKNGRSQLNDRLVLLDKIEFQSDNAADTPARTQITRNGDHVTAHMAAGSSNPSVDEWGWNFPNWLAYKGNEVATVETSVRVGNLEW